MKRPRRAVLLWLLGAAAIVTVTVAAADPALVVLALDPELFAVLVLSGFALLRVSAANAARSVCFAFVARLKGMRGRPPLSGGLRRVR